MMLALAALHGLVLLAAPSAPLIAVGLWWNANTISHAFIHRPFFHRPLANHLFAAYLSALLGFPHSMWRERHLGHHVRSAGSLHATAAGGSRQAERVIQAALVASVWIVVAARAPRAFLFVYLPGYAAGLALCALHGHYEHARGVTSYYGVLYNWLFFNDGYHAEHHARPDAHWKQLPEVDAVAERVSGWPSPLRWMDLGWLEALERLVLRSRLLQRFMIRSHTSALSGLVGTLPPVRRVAVIGGGLFPRTAIALRALLPHARVAIVDSSRVNLDRARSWTGTSSVEFVHGRYPYVDLRPYDLVVFPLSFDGRRDRLYANPPARSVIVHDWIWRRRGASRVVSAVLLKRLNLV